MSKIKIFFSTVIFSILLIGTSVVKNKTREIEKQISNITKNINNQEKDLNESQLDFFYLTSPSIVEDKIKFLVDNNYIPMDRSKIFLNIINFTQIKNKFVNQKNSYDKKTKKK